MPLPGSKLLTDLTFGKANRRRQEDKQRWANAQAQGFTRRGYEMMAPFDIPIPAANPVSYPRRRYPIPPHHLIDQGPHRGRVRQGHPIGRLPVQQPLHPFYSPPHHPADPFLDHPGYRPRRRRRPFIEEDFENDRADDDDEDDDDDDDEDEDDDDDDDDDSIWFSHDLVGDKPRSYTRARRHRHHPEHGNHFALRDPRAIMAPHGHRHGMYGNPFDGQRGAYADPYAMGGRQRGYSDTESIVTW